MSAERKLKEGYSHFDRFYLGFTLRKNYRRITLAYRNLTQYQPQGDVIFDVSKVPSMFNRNKLVLRYSLRERWAIYISEEVNIPLTYSYKFDYISRSRTVVGGIYQISKYFSIEPYCMFQRKFTFKGQPARDFVIGLTLGLDLK